MVDKYNCKVPYKKDELISFPGVGRKTINVFLSEFYNIPAIAVDTHVERVSKRLRLAPISSDVLKIEKKLKINKKNKIKIIKKKKLKVETLII